MSDIQDLDLVYIKNFLLINNIVIPKDKKKIYEKAFELMSKKSTLYNGTDVSIDEWILAYNAVKRNIDIKLYHINDINNMSESELSNLAKKLELKKVNITNIINILRFMNKFDTKIEQQTITGIYDLDKILLQTIDNEELNNLTVNDYTKKILNDQNFWKERLQKRLGLKTNKKLDFKFITKFLDNGKSFEENYQSAISNNFFDIVNILIENNVVMLNKPNHLSENIHITIDELGEIKNYSYEDFIKYIFNKTNEILIDSEEDPIDISYFDEEVYTGDAIIIEIPNALYDPFDEKSQEMVTYIFRNKNGFTNGEILYELAQKIPNEDEIKQNNIEFVRKHPDDILTDIKSLFPYVEQQQNRGYNVSEDLKYLKKYYNIIIISELLKDPVKFLKYNEKHPNNYVREYNSTEIWGNHVYWEGLTYYDNQYHLNLGS